MSLLKTFYYELYKLWSFKYLRVIFILLLAVNSLSAWIFSYDYISAEIERPEYNFTREEMKELIKKAEEDPEWYESEYNRVMREWDDWFEGPAPVDIYTNNDLGIFLRSYRLLHAHEDFREKINTVLDDAERILLVNSFYGSDPDIDAINDYQYDVIERYTDLLQNVEPYESHTYGWAAYFDYIVASLLMFIWTTMLAVTACHEHISSGFISISRISKHGRGKCAIAKLIAILLVIVVSVFAFMGTTMLIIELRISFTGGEAQIQMLGDIYYPSDVIYDYVPLDLSIREFAFVNALIECVVMVVFAAAVALVTTLSNNIAGYIFGIVLFVSQFIISRLQIITTSQWKNINLVSVVSDSVFLTKLREVMMFGRAWDLLPVSLLIFAVLTIIFAVFAVWNYSKRRAVAKSGNAILKKILGAVEETKRKLEKSIKRSYPTSLWKYELTKTKIYFCLLAVLSVLIVVTTFDYYTPPTSAYDRMYGDIMQELEGIYTNEKAEYIEETYRKYAEIAGQIDKYNNDLMNGVISSYQYKQWYKEYQVASGQLPVWEDLVEKSYYLESQPGAWYFYDTGVIKHSNQDNNWYILVFILLLGGGLFHYEYNKTSSGSAVMSVIRTTKHGRQKFINTKFIFVTVVSFAAAVFANATEIIVYLLKYDTSAIGAPLYSLEHYANAPEWMTIGIYFTLTAILSVIGTVMLMLIASSISSLGERAATVYPIITLVFLLPYAASELGIGFMSYVDITRLSDAQRLFSLVIPHSPWLIAVYYLILIVITYICVHAVYRKTERGI